MRIRIQIPNLVSHAIKILMSQGCLFTEWSMQNKFSLMTLPFIVLFNTSKR